MKKEFIYTLLLCNTFFFLINTTPLSTYPFMSDQTFVAFCDHVGDIRNIKSGDTLYIDNAHIGNFFTKLHPRIKCPYILVSHGIWHSMPGPHAIYLDAPKLIAWFAKNGNPSVHKKMHTIPIGLGNKDNYSSGFIEFLKKLIPTVTPPQQRRSDKLMYINMTLRTNKIREEMYNKLKDKEFCYVATRKPDKEFIKKLSEFRFVASPKGLGTDCHRTWEAMLVGTIPIIDRSEVSHIFEDLPVLIIDNWDQITREFLEEKFTEIMSKSYNLKKLYADYWFDQIRETQKRNR